MYLLKEIVLTSNQSDTCATNLCDAYLHEPAGNPRGTRLLVGRHMTISPPMKIETKHGRGRSGRSSLNIQILDCILKGVEWFVFVYVCHGG